MKSHLCQLRIGPEAREIDGGILVQRNHAPTSLARELLLLHSRIQMIAAMANACGVGGLMGTPGQCKTLRD